MFAPNSIKTLMSIKNYNQLDQSRDGGMRNSFTPKDADKDNKQDIDHSSMQHRDMTDKVISTRVLLKEIDYKIEDLKKWKQRQRKDLEKQLAENKKMSANMKIDDSTTLQTDNYDKYIEKLEEMMNLYQADLEEARKVARDQNSSSNLVMSEIGDQLSERENRIAELSDQLCIIENQKNFDAHSKEIDFIGDIQSLKHNLEDWRKGLRLASRSSRDISSTFITRGEGKEDDSLKGFIEKEKNEISTSKNQKYNFKDDLDDIDAELKELEEMFNAK